MPELPEVETVCRGLRPVLEGAVIQDVVIRQFILRIPIPSDFRERLKSRKIIKVKRRAKYILIDQSHNFNPTQFISSQIILTKTPPP